MRRIGLVALLLCLPGPGAGARERNAPGTPPPTQSGGYRIWFDPDQVWHLRGVGAGKERRFHGTLTMPGGWKSVKPVPPQVPVQFLGQDSALRFDFRTAAEAGFDFRTDAECVVLELKVDERHLPKLVRIGAGGDTPALFPYEACR